MNVKRIAALGLTGALSVSLLSGCGVNKNATIATMGDQKISLGVAYFLARYEQSSYDDMFLAYVGDGFWDEDLYGTGSTMEETVKDNVMEELHTYYTLQNHMSDYGIELTDDQKTAITEAATEFMTNNDKASLKEMGATQEIVEEVLTLYTVKSLMYDAIIADADTDVTDEEANMRGYTYIEIPTDSTTTSDGETYEYSDDEKTVLSALASEMLAEINTGAVETSDEDTDEAVAEDETSDEEVAEDETSDEEVEEDVEDETVDEDAADEEDDTTTVEDDTDTEDTEEEDEDIMSTVATNYGYSATYATYDADDDSLDETVKTALDELSEGDDAVVVSTDTSIYILRLDAETDEDATATNREDIISDRQSTLYDDTLSGWQEDDGWKIKERVLAKIKFDDYFTTVEDTESDAEVTTEN